VTSVPIIPIPTVISSETTPIRQYIQRARIAQSSALPPVADELASPVRDESRAAEVSTGSGSIPTTGPSAAEVPTGSDVVPTA
nr:hypothetical protein [Tanacetum cinerariifolium]